MKKLTLFFLFLGLFAAGVAKTITDAIPPVPNPPRLVNDFAGVMTLGEVTEMEDRLVAFNDTTTNVICVVTVNDLGDYSAAQFAYEIDDRWGVRSKDRRNGVVILIKPSTGNGDGDVYISVGYDLEGAIPDAIAKRIIDQKMIPELSEGRYKAAIDSALAYIIPLALGEISPDEFRGFIGQNIRLEPVILHNDFGIKELLEYYMGKNTMERQNFIIDNLVIEEDRPEDYDTE